ncbi:MAG: hypothetical protein ACJ72C_06420 [Nitrososphaeraceae archaeon]
MKQKHLRKLKRQHKMKLMNVTCNYHQWNNRKCDAANMNGVVPGPCLDQDTGKIIP